MTDNSKPIKRKRKNHIPPTSQSVKRKRTNVDQHPPKKKRQLSEQVAVKHREKKTNATILIVRSALWDADISPHEISNLLENIADDKKAAFLEQVRDLVTDLIKSDGTMLESRENEDVAAASESTGEL